MGGKNSTTTQTITIPPEVLARYRAVNQRAEGVSNTPFQQYSQDPSAFVAQFNPTQQAGVNTIANAAGMAMPFYGQAADYTRAGAGVVGPLTQDQISYYQDPFTSQVAGTTFDYLRQQQQQEMQGATANAIRSGAFGGDRSGLVAANLARQQQLGTAQAIAPILSQGYQFGAQTAAGQQGVAAADLNRLMQAGGQFANLGSGLSGATLAAGQGLLGAGTAQQQTDQAGLSALYNQFQQERAYPFQVAQFLANIAMGTGALSGSTTTTQQPAPFFSDERLKDNIEPIGELFDGQKVYRYDMDGRKQIGLLAQEVEEHKPEAVGLARGFRTVDYDKATEDAERSAHANGGSVFDNSTIQQLLQTQQGMYSGLYGQPGTPRGAQGMPGAQSYVPAANLPVGRLATPNSPPQQQTPGLAQAAQTAGNVRALVDLASSAKDKMMAGYKSLTGDQKPGVAGPMNIVPRSQEMDRTQIGAGVAPQASAPMPPPRPQSMAEVPGTLDEFTSTFAARGGRIERAAGGSIPYQSNGYFPEEILDQKTPELATPGKAPSAPASGSSGLTDALKLGSSLYSAGSTLAPAVSSAASALLAFLPFSDERLKNNVREVGETFDGQGIYAYEMGDGRTRIGLMAQEVEKRKPDAVGLAAGYKTLDYDRATENAAGLGRKARADGGATEDFPEEIWRRNIKQESGGRQFDKDGRPLTSSKGAIGIAQVMPKTAPEAAKLAGVPFDEDRYQNDSEYNEKIGRAYFREQYRRFGDPLIATAAYNAGPGAVEKALRRAQESGNHYLSYLPEETKKHVAAVSGAANQAINLALNNRPREEEARAVPGVAGPGRGPTDAASSPFTYLTQGMFEGKDPQLKAALTSENFWVPIVTGVGTMLASRSPWLGNAIGEGLVGGVQAYKDIQKQQQEMGESRARTEATMANVAGDAIRQIGDRIFVRFLKPGGGYDYIAYNEWLALPPNARPQLDPRAMEAVRGLPGNTPAAAPKLPAPSPAEKPAGATPAAAPPAAPEKPASQPAINLDGLPATPPPSGVGPASVPAPRPALFTLSPEQKAAAEAAAKQKAGWSMARVNQEPDFFGEQDALARAVSDQKQLILPLAGTLAALPRDTNLATSGKAQEILYPVMGFLNNIAAIAGKPDLIQDPTVLAKQEEVRKLTNQLQQSATSASQQRAFAAFKEMAEGIPGILTSPGGQSKLIAQILTNAQSTVDKNEFFNSWAQAAGGERGQFSEFAKATSREAEREFNKKFTNAFYARERQKLEEMFKDKVNVEGKPMSILEVVSLRPDLMTPKRKAQIEREYGTGILRYFGIN